MPETLSKNIVLHRCLIEPGPLEIGELIVSLIREVGSTMPLTPNIVRFTHPGRVTVPILGGLALSKARELAQPNSALLSLTPLKLTQRVTDALPPSAHEPATARSKTTRLTDFKRSSFGTFLTAPAISLERRLASEATRVLAGLPKLNHKATKNYSLKWVRFTAGNCPPELETNLTALTHKLLPPGRELVFDKVEPIDLATAPSPYLEFPFIEASLDE